MTGYFEGKRARWNLGSTEERAAPDFVFEANIAHFKERLATETDARKIATLRKLLAEEEAKLADSQAKKQRPNAAKS